MLTYIRFGTLSLEELKEKITNQNIFDKIEFSEITKEDIKEKLIALDTQVANRQVLLDVPDEKVKENWFKNWLHPKLKKMVITTSKDKRGTSAGLRQREAQWDIYGSYENGQQNFKYNLQDIENYVGM